jgi:hypothetical protein
MCQTQQASLSAVLSARAALSDCLFRLLVQLKLLVCILLSERVPRFAVMMHVCIYLFSLFTHARTHCVGMYRDQFIRLHSQPITERLRAEFLARYADHVIFDPPATPADRVRAAKLALAAARGTADATVPAAGTGTDTLLAAAGPVRAPDHVRRQPFSLSLCLWLSAYLCVPVPLCELNVCVYA